MHLHVGDVDEAARFYRDVIGFDVMASLPGASFVSAGGYHHHLGLNNWRGQGVPPAPPGTVGLRHWTLVLDGPEELRRVRAAWTPPAFLRRSAPRESPCATPPATSSC